MTLRLKEILRSAGDLARLRGHVWIEPEHLAYALICEAGGIGALVLKDLHAKLDSAGKQLEAILPEARRASTDEPAMSGRSQAVLEQATVEAAALGHGYQGSEHLLIALFSAEGPMLRLVGELQGISATEVRARVRRLIPGG
jgi:ATP-dependent Clp protease ATP-binding subunit ClpC